MRVGILTAFYPQMIGGAEASLEVLLKAYDQAGVDHVLFTMNQRAGSDPAHVRSIPSLPRIPKQLIVGGFPLLDEMVGKRLPGLINESKVSLLHIVDFYSVCGGVLGASNAGVPALFTCQNDIGTPFEAFGARFPLNRWMRARERQAIAAIKKCSTTVAVSAFIAGQLTEAGVPPSRIKVVHVPGIMIEWPSYSPRADRTRLRILGLGRLYRDKGFQVLLRAAAQLHASGTKFELHLAGRGPYTRVLLRLAKDLGLDEEFQYLGQVPRPKIADLIDWSDVVVVPTITPEPFPRAGVEAMSRGKPLIGSRVGGIPELIGDGETGYLVSPGQPTELADKLRTLASDPDLLESMGRRALDGCRSRFDSKVIVRQLTEIYDRALSANLSVATDSVGPGAGGGSSG